MPVSVKKQKQTLGKQFFELFSNIFFICIHTHTHTFKEMFTPNSEKPYIVT